MYYLCIVCTLQPVLYMTVAQCPVLSNISNTSAEPVFPYTYMIELQTHDG